MKLHHALFLLITFSPTYHLQASNPSVPGNGEDWTVINEESTPTMKACVSAILKSEEERPYWSSFETGINSFLNWIKENYHPDFTINVCYAKLPIDAKHEHVLLSTIVAGTFSTFAAHLTHERTTRWLDRALQTAVTGLREENTRLLLQAAHKINILNNVPPETRDSAVQFLKNIAAAKQALITERVAAYCADTADLANLIALTSPQTAKALELIATKAVIQEKTTHVVQKLTELASNKTLPVKSSTT